MPPLLELLPHLLDLVPTLDLLPLLLGSCQTSRSCWTSGLLPLLLDLVPLLAKLDLLPRHLSCLLNNLPLSSDVGLTAPPLPLNRLPRTLNRLPHPPLLLLSTSSTSMMQARTHQTHGARGSKEFR